MRIIVEKPRNTRPDPAIEAGSLATRVTLSPNVQHVKSGTPLRPSQLGWEPAPDGKHVVMFAYTGGYGGDVVTVAREVVLDVGDITPPLTPGARYGVADIDATGYTRFAPEAEGPYTALTDRTILLTPDV